MKTYKLALMYSWEFDEDFVKLFVKKLRFTGIRTIFINYKNYIKIAELIREKKIHIEWLWDRATDDDDCFQIILQAYSDEVRVINDYKAMQFSSDKATMHLELISKGLNTPFTIIIDPFNNEKEIKLSLSDLANLGRPFIIKPANTTGGGIGVVLGAETLNDVLHARQMLKDDKYLLQKKIEPKIIGDYRFWFRCFWAFDEIILSWWNDQTHIYTIMTEQEIEKFNLYPLYEIVEKIHSICQLNFFSTEIALDENNNFIVIDYVNDMCDLRLKSIHPDGVPDLIIEKIINSLIKFLKAKNVNEKQNN